MYSLLLVSILRFLLDYYELGLFHLGMEAQSATSEHAWGETTGIAQVYCSMLVRASHEGD